jgi:hypothetical protein
MKPKINEPSATRRLSSDADQPTTPSSMQASPSYCPRVGPDASSGTTSPIRVPYPGTHRRMAMAVLYCWLLSGNHLSSPFRSFHTSVFLDCWCELHCLCPHLGFRYLLQVNARGAPLSAEVGPSLMTGMKPSTYKPWEALRPRIGVLGYLIVLPR